MDGIPRGTLLAENVCMNFSRTFISNHTPLLAPALFALVGGVILFGCSSESISSADPPASASPEEEVEKEDEKVPSDPTRWVEGSSLRISRSAHTATLLKDGRVLIVGGERRDRTMNANTEFIDTKDGAVSAGPNTPLTLSNHGASLLPNGDVLVMGGGHSNSIGSPDGSEARAETFIYRVAKNDWEKAAPMSTPRSYFGLARLADGRVLVAGGAGSEHVTQFLPGSGANEELGKALSSVELFDPKTESWSSLPPLSEARFFAQALALPDGRVLVVGGSNEMQESFKTCELLDAKQEKWTPCKGQPATERFFHRLALLGDGRVVMAGGKHANVRFHTSVEVFDPVAETWSELTDLEESGTAIALTSLPSGRVLIAGGYACGIACAPLAFSGTIDGQGNVKRFDLKVARAQHSLTLLPDGRVVAAGGLIAKIAAP